MKKIKILSLLLAVIMLASAFVSCGAGVGTISSFKKVLNPDYVPTSTFYGVSTELTDVKGYELEDCNEEIAIFKSVNDTGETTFKVYSLRANKIVQTFKSSATSIYTVEIFGDAPIFFVTNAKLASSSAGTEGNEEEELPEGEQPEGEQPEGEQPEAEEANTDATSTEADFTYTLYNHNGKELDKKTKNVGKPIVFADMVIYNSVMYTIKEGASLVKNESKLPENLALSACDEWNDEYLYVFDDKEAGLTVSVFDREFNSVFFWEAPASALNINSFVLDNGNILVQYNKKLATDAEKYDIYDYAKDGTVEKYDLVSVLLNPKGAKEKNVALDYLVLSVYSYTDASRDAKMADKYAENFKNIAYICPVVNGSVDYSQTALDIVLMDGNAKITGSVKLADQQTASMPEMLGENLYYVDTFYGFALVDAKGKVVTPVNNSAMNINDKYIMGQKAIYNFDFEVVYDLDKNDAEVVGWTDNAVFVRTGNIKDYKIFSIYNNKATQIASSSKKNNAGTQVEIVDSINCYALYDNLNEKYSYYNEQGTLIVEAPSLLTVIYTSNSLKTCLLSATDGSYYVFSSKAGSNQSVNNNDTSKSDSESGSEEDNSDSDSADEEE